MHWFYVISVLLHRGRQESPLMWQPGRLWVAPWSPHTKTYHRFPVPKANALLEHKWEARAKFYPAEVSWLCWWSYWLMKGLQTISRLSAFWVESSFTFLPRSVVSWVAQLPWIPRNVSSFPWPQRFGFHLCLTMSISSSQGSWSTHSMLETLCLLGCSLPAQPAVGSSSILYLRVLSCSLYLSIFSGCILFPEYIIRKVSRQTSFMQLLLFQIVCDISTWSGNQPLLKFYQQSHSIYSLREITERRDLDQSLIPTLPVFCKAKLSSIAKWKLAYKHSFGKAGQQSGVRSIQLPKR